MKKEPIIWDKEKLEKAREEKRNSINIEEQYLSKKKSNKELYIWIVVFLIGLIITITFFVLDSKAHDPHIKSIEESQADLEKARKARLEAELKYINAVENAEQAEHSLQEAELYK